MMRSCSEPPNRDVLVLFVDDDPEVRMLYTGALRDAGLLVDEACTADEALATAPSLHPDVIVLDRYLPDGDGWEVARKLKGLPSLRDVPILGFTASGEQRGDVESALIAGCDVFVPKPCAPDMLVRYVFGMIGLDVEDPPSSRLRMPDAPAMTPLNLPSAAGTARPSRGR
jgi:two-component system, cell cycle response regulator DivK